jgi:hypothetical protein
MTEGMVEVSKAQLSVWSNDLSYFVGLLAVLAPDKVQHLAKIRDEVRGLASG